MSGSQTGGEVKDVFKLVVFLASNESGFIAGSDHIVHGGLTSV